MIAIQLALCMQLGTICHLYSPPKLLEKPSFRLEPQYECSVLPRIFLRNSGGGQALLQGGGRNVRDYLVIVFIGKEVKQERNLRARKKKQKQ